MYTGRTDRCPAWMQGRFQMDQKQESRGYEAPKAEVVEVTGTARCISTSVPIDDGTGNIDPGDIG